MEKIVVDSSIVVKWFIDEEGSKKARLLFKEHQEERISLYAPDIIIIEVVNALFFKADFPKNQLKDVVRKLFQAEIKFVYLEQYLIQKSVDIMIEHKIASYDALFTALAQDLDCPLIINDRKHHLKKIYKKIRYL